MEVVHIDAPPFSGRLAAWGHDGQAWLGLFVWPQRVRFNGDQRSELSCCAWVPADRLTNPLWAGDVQVPRLGLVGDPAGWPRPPGWDGWYAGLWAAGAAPLPDGVTAVNGPAWQDKPLGRD